MFSLKPPDANDPQGLMRRKEPNKQTNKHRSNLCKCCKTRHLQQIYTNGQQEHTDGRQLYRILKTDNRENKRYTRKT